MLYYIKMTPFMQFANLYCYSCIILILCIGNKILHFIGNKIFSMEKAFSFSNFHSTFSSHFFFFKSLYLTLWQRSLTNFCWSQCTLTSNTHHVLHIVHKSAVLWLDQDIPIRCLPKLTMSDAHSQSHPGFFYCQWQIHLETIF